MNPIKQINILERDEVAYIAEHLSPVEFSTLLQVSQGVNSVFENLYSEMT